MLDLNKPGGYVKKLLLVFLSILPIKSIAVTAGEKLRDLDHFDFNKRVLLNKKMFEYCTFLFENKNRTSSIENAYQKINQLYPHLTPYEKELKLNEIVTTLIENDIISLHKNVIILTGNPSGYKTE